MSQYFIHIAIRQSMANSIQYQEISTNTPSTEDSQTNHPTTSPTHQYTPTTIQQTSSLIPQHLNELYNQVSCDSCNQDITHFTRFLINSEDYYIQQDDEYFVVNSLTFALFQPQWSAYEELMLFEAIDRLGFGNWDEIGQFMGTNKSGREVQQHYNEVYLSEAYCSQETITKKTQQGIDFVHSSNRREIISQNIYRKERQLKQTSIQMVNQINVAKTTVIDDKATPKLQENQPHLNIIGYYPLRQQFQINFNEDLELLLAEMRYQTTDSLAQTQQKDIILTLYMLELKRRYIIQAYALNNHLLSVDKLNENKDKECSKEQKALVNMMKCFKRYSQNEDFEELMQGIVEERAIKRKIKALARQKGIIVNKKYTKRKKQNKNTSNKSLSLSKIDISTHPLPTLSRKLELFTMFLSPEELQICEKHNLLPRKYQMIKQAIVKETMKSSNMMVNNRKSIFQMFILDEALIGQMLDLIQMSLKRTKDKERMDIIEPAPSHIVQTHIETI